MNVIVCFLCRVWKKGSFSSQGAVKVALSFVFTKGIYLIKQTLQWSLQMSHFRTSLMHLLCFDHRSLFLVLLDPSRSFNRRRFNVMGTSALSVGVSDMKACILTSIFSWNDHVKMVQRWTKIKLFMEKGYPDRLVHGWRPCILDTRSRSDIFNGINSCGRKSDIVNF